MQFKLLLLILAFSSAAHAMHRPPDIRLEMREEPSPRSNKLDDCVQAGIRCSGKFIFCDPLDKNEQRRVSRWQVAGAAGSGLGAAWLSCSCLEIGIAAVAGCGYGRLAALTIGACEECCYGKEKEE